MDFLEFLRSGRAFSINQIPKRALPRMFATKPGFVGVVWFKVPKIVNRRGEARAVEQMPSGVPVSAGAVVL